MKGSPPSLKQPMLRLSDIVGQDSAVNRLREAMATGRRPHALLFAGPAGVGRRTTAMALAATLLCEGPAAARPGGDPCGRCEGCRMLSAGTHPDLHLVYKELAAYHDDPKVREQVMQVLGIPVIRQFLIAPAGGAAARGRGKVFLVLEAELMSDEAQNSLLRTLEEPPRGVTIVLICQRPEDLLATTLSRCWMLRFGPLPRAFVLEKLRQAGVDGPAAEFWAAFAEGSAGQAVRLAGQAGLYDAKRHIVEGLAELGGDDDSKLPDELAKLTDALAAAAVKQAASDSGVEMSKNLATRQAVAVLLGIVAGAFRDALHLACWGREAEDRLVHADQPQAVARIAERLTAEQLAQVLQQLARYEELLWRNVNPRLVWDNAVITCASAAPLRV